MANLISIRDFAALQQRDSREYENELISMNEVSSEYGLILTKAEAHELIETRSKALHENGRIEIGIGSIKGLIESFASSSYLTQENYAETLNDLIEIFYFMKTETRDSVSDKELLETMRDQFENKYHGSVELMQGREFRYQKHADDALEGYDDDATGMRRLQMNRALDEDDSDPDLDDYRYLWETGGRKKGNIQ